MIEILGLIGTFIFGLLSLFLFIIQREIMKPIVLYSITNLQTKNHSDIQIYFKDKKVFNLNRIYILFVNKGKKAIRKNDVPNNKYPQIVFNEKSKLLLANILKVSSQDIDLKIEQNNNSLEIQFDYLNYNDGTVIEIFVDSEQKNLPAKVVAPIINSEKIKVIKFNPNLSLTFWNSISLVIWALFLFGLPAYFFLDNYINSNYESYGNLIGITIFIGLFLFGMYVFFKNSSIAKIPNFAKNYFK